MRRYVYRRYPWLRRLRRRGFAVLVAIALVPAVVDAANGWLKAEGGCHVWRLLDGDTIVMRCPDGFVRLRLRDIDTPEMRAGCWGEAWRALAAKQRLRWAFLHASEIALPGAGPSDRYGRRLGQAMVDGQPVADQLIDARLAVPYIPGDISWCDRIDRGQI